MMLRSAKLVFGLVFVCLGLVDLVRGTVKGVSGDKPAFTQIEKVGDVEKIYGNDAYSMRVVTGKLEANEDETRDLPSDCPYLWLQVKKSATVDELNLREILDRINLVIAMLPEDPLILGSLVIEWCDEFNREESLDTWNSRLVEARVQSRHSFMLLVDCPLQHSSEDIVPRESDEVTNAKLFLEDLLFDINERFPNLYCLVRNKANVKIPNLGSLLYVLPHGFFSQVDIAVSNQKLDNFDFDMFELGYEGRLFSLNRLAIHMPHAQTNFLSVIPNFRCGTFEISIYNWEGTLDVICNRERSPMLEFNEVKVNIHEKGVDMAVTAETDLNKSSDWIETINVVGTNIDDGSAALSQDTIFPMLNDMITNMGMASTKGRIPVVRINGEIKTDEFNNYE
ncbi:hypothetical protein NEHOM01_2125 [Nematocida homosporus]|uniref:uncharacterized protein n=1 Tax=Nematocida homosporus TaxID=1912981 RepID=UPI002220BA6C|nr:uncharacterized protein NEHOM01_2125 [Nematocida homosporus]KAI5187371.1 hypothetical protein NEHOM01_2125 [Nematocida homosporus]